jgi:hypothetical protein
MTLEQQINDWKTGVEQVPWDSVRERRVLNRLTAGRRAAAGHSYRRLLLGATAIAASAAAVLVAFLVFGDATEPDEPLPGGGSIPDQDGPAAIAAAGTFKLQDGSVATYLTPAVLEVEEQSATAIHLSQLHGQVRYEVVRSPGRNFVVNANGIEIQVVGTVFVVDVDLVDVHVKVEHGQVVVDSGSGIVELGAGEEIILACRDSATPDQGRGRDEPESRGLSVAINAREGPHPNGDVKTAPSFDQLLREADRARRAGDNDLAASTLRKLISLYPGNGRIVSVLFTLGKVESQRGRYVEAARAFRKCWRSSPRGTLAEDAHYQEAISWDRIGRIREAQAAARRYLESYPHGPYADRMRRISQ